MQLSPSRSLLFIAPLLFGFGCNSQNNSEASDAYRHHPHDLAGPLSPADMTVGTADSGGTVASDGGAAASGDLAGPSGGPGAPFSLGAVDPGGAPAGATVALTGSGFQAGDTVQISNATIGTLTLVTVSLSSTLIWATLPSTVPVGAANFAVVRSGVSSKTVPFTVTPGSIHFIAPNGSDSNAGTYAQPWLNIGVAASKMKPGDTAYLRGGTYQGSWSISASGAQGAQLNFIGYPGETPLLYDLASGSSVNTLTISGAYVTVDHVRISGQHTPSNGIELNASAHDVFISNCEVFGTKGQGIVVVGAHNYFLRNAVHDNGVNTNKDHGFYIEGQGNTLRGNRIYNNWCYGIQLYSDNGLPAGSNLIEGNFIYHNGFGAVTSAGSTASAGMVVAGPGTNDTIRNNVFCDNANYAVYVEASVANEVFSGNISCYHPRGGFWFEYTASGMAFTGNISFNDGGPGLIGQPPLVSNNNDYWRTSGPPVVQWSEKSYSSVTTLSAASGQDAQSRVVDPKFTNVPTSGFDSTQMSSYNFCTALNPALCN